MIQIDGAAGEGGGQVLRSSLALSILTQKPVIIDTLRGGREKSGLLRQHLTALRAAAEISGAQVEGAELRSHRIRFTPGRVRPGSYRFDIGSAGSANLVLQTVLPPLMLADGDSELIVEGGTHNSKSPPFDFLQVAFLPLLRRMGVAAEIELIRPGFYPAGGGRIALRIHPARSLSPLSLTEVGERRPLRARIYVAVLPRGVGNRELMTLREQLTLEWRDTEIIEVDDPRGPGNAVHVFAESDHLTEVFTGFGERRKPAEQVSTEVAAEVSAYLAAGAPVGEHLADQLLLPAALAGGGRYHTVAPSLHTTTNIQIIQRFLDVPITTTPHPSGSGSVEIRVGRDAEAQGT